MDSTFLPEDLGDDEIILNQWAAADLDVKRGDSVQLKYYVLGLNRQLVEDSVSLTVHSVVLLAGKYLDPDLMPDFPGLSQEENCRDWHPGFPVNLDRIRPKDEDYWDQWKGTPKAFVTLAAGQKMWANRYGNLTAVRYPANEITKEQVETKILAAVEPASVGLYFEPVISDGVTEPFGSIPGV